MWPAYGHLLFRLGRMELLNLPNLPKKLASTHLDEAKNVLRVTHGEGHPLHKGSRNRCESQILQQANWAAGWAIHFGLFLSGCWCCKIWHELIGGRRAGGEGQPYIGTAGYCGFVR